MRIKCNDGFIREFIPANGMDNFATIEKSKLTRAYCKHCNQEFTLEPSSVQKPVWREHSCNVPTVSYRRWKDLKFE